MVNSKLFLRLIEADLPFAKGKYKLSTLTGIKLNLLCYGLQVLCFKYNARIVLLLELSVY